MNVIKKVYSRFYKALIFFRSYLQSVVLRISTKRKYPNSCIEGKMMILVPHADDEIVGCGCIITNAKNKCFLINMDMPGGDSLELHEQRRRELGEMVNNLPSDTEIVDLRDEPNKTMDLSILIDSINPDYICVPEPYDWHCEHLKVRHILYEALKLVKTKTIKIVEYQVSVPMPLSNVSHGLKMTKEQQKNKWNVFKKIYRTQAFFPVWRYKFNERIYGAVCGSYASELYRVFDVDLWIKNFQSRIISDDERNNIMNNFRNLVKIRRIVKKYKGGVE